VFGTQRSFLQLRSFLSTPTCKLRMWTTPSSRVRSPPPLYSFSFYCLPSFLLPLYTLYTENYAPSPFLFDPTPLHIYHLLCCARRFGRMVRSSPLVITDLAAAIYPRALFYSLRPPFTTLLRPPSFFLYFYYSLLHVSSAICPTPPTIAPLRPPDTPPRTRTPRVLLVQVFSYSLFPSVERLWASHDPWPLTTQNP
jgi:hypothetical protein